MGLFSKESKEPKVIHTSERQKCWAARDTLFKCFDEAEVIDAIKDDSKARKSCPQQFAEFEAACVASWQQYFKQKRVADKQREARIKELEAAGYMPLEKPLEKAQVYKN